MEHMDTANMAACDSCDCGFASNQQFISRCSRGSSLLLLLSATPSSLLLRDVMVPVLMPVVLRYGDWSTNDLLYLTLDPGAWGRGTRRTCPVRNLARWNFFLWTVEFVTFSYIFRIFFEFLGLCPRPHPVLCPGIGPAGDETHSFVSSETNSWLRPCKLDLSSSRIPSRWLHWATRRRHSALSFASSSASSQIKSTCLRSRLMTSTQFFLGRPGFLL